MYVSRVDNPGCLDGMGEGEVGHHVISHLMCLVKRHRGYGWAW